MTAQETIASLETQLQHALDRLGQVTEQLQQTQEQLQQAHARIVQLEKLKTPAPPFVKANKNKPPAQQKQPRQKRDAKHNQARQRAVPRQVVEHRLLSCPACQLRLGGITLARVREVIDVPVPPPVQVTHHRIYKGWCANCQKWHEAPVDLHEQVLGQGRIGVRLASIMAYLRTVMRLPLRQLQSYLLNLHGFQVSAGEIVELLQRIHQHTQPLLDFRLKRRSEPVPPSKPMRRDGGKMAATATSGVSPRRAFATMSTITRGQEKWSSS